ncbi:TonB-dependent receptor family protein [Salisaeta longa]|uniref:TonB-dependent receptor family protein n=1 Tax=Salisaeta longa TaxID=503170 RepID=UPI0004167DDD|nr:TonB-dependent receptor [Salisaeta longa]
MRPFVFALCFLGLCAANASAQQGTAPAPVDTQTVRLRPVIVRSTPFALTTRAAPFAVSVVERSAADLNTRAALALEDFAYGVPGVWISSREHYALGYRITMRGMGWRSQFGVRGVQIVMDGIPLTTADGQSVLNIVDPSFIRRMEVIRGPASTFWGNSSGGVVYLSTQPPADAAPLRFRQVVGSYGLSKTDVQLTPDVGPHTLSAYGSYLTQDGYRSHSSARLARAGATGRFVLGPQQSLRVMGAFSSMPEAESPGSIGQQAVRANPQQARDAFTAVDAGKTSMQGQVGATYTHHAALGTVRATGYGLFRDLENPLPFAYITVDRRGGGGRLTWERDLGAVGWGLGAAVKLQRDDRVEYGIGDDGQRLRDVRLVDQLETVRTLAAFGRGTYAMGRLQWSAGVRYDRLRFAATDRTAGRADTGARTFQALSPSVGVQLMLPQTRLYASVSTALETPTTTELGNRPDGGGGFNPTLQPARTVGLEVGAQGRAAPQRLRYDLTLFGMQVRNLLLPFQNANDETFFRNAGRARHLGVEAAVRWRLPHNVRWRTSYTYVRARLTSGTLADGTSITGNEVPGVPPHRWSGALAWTPPRPLHLSINYRLVHRYAVNSANTAANDGYTVFDVRASHPGLPLTDALLLQPFVEVNNVLGATYTDAVVVNAFGGRYYEPAAGRHWRAGLSLQLQ